LSSLARNLSTIRCKTEAIMFTRISLRKNEAVRAKRRV
jgi:hypothetical protein